MMINQPVRLAEILYNFIGCDEIMIEQCNGQANGQSQKQACLQWVSGEAQPH